MKVFESKRRFLKTKPGKGWDESIQSRSFNVDQITSMTEYQKSDGTYCTEIFVFQNSFLVNESVERIMELIDADYIETLQEI